LTIRAHPLRKSEGLPAASAIFGSCSELGLSDLINLSCRSADIIDKGRLQLLTPRWTLSITSVVVVPLRTRSGTRPKVLEGLAMANVRSRQASGARDRANINGGVRLLIEGDPARFAAAAGRRIVRTQLAAPAALVESRYSWSSITRGLDNLGAEVLAASS
jgi:hypothetical protein